MKNCILINGCTKIFIKLRNFLASNFINMIVFAKLLYIRYVILECTYYIYKRLINVYFLQIIFF